MNGLKYILIMNGMGYEDLANRLGVKKQRIDLYTVGKQPIPINHAETLLDLFNIPIEILNKELTKEDLLYILDHNEDHANMIGLKYIMMVCDIRNQDLADWFGISKENVSRWAIGDSSIPLKYKNVISHMLNLPVIYLEKELNRKDIKDILQLEGAMQIKNIEDVYTRVTKKIEPYTKLKYLIDLKETTVVKLSEKLGIKRGIMYMCSNGKRNISFEHAKIYAKEFNVSVEYFKQKLTEEEIEKAPKVKKIILQKHIKDVQEEPLEIKEIKEVSKEKNISILEQKEVGNLFLKLPLYYSDKLYHLAEDEFRTMEQQATKILVDYLKKI
jgi:transcriptional regulator with XRE-family HTH domain